MKNTKICKQCGRELDINMFNISHSTKDGRKTKCKGCESEYYKRYYKDVKDYVRKGYILKSMFLPLAVIGYKYLKDKYGAVTYDIIKQMVKAPRINTEKSIKYIEEYILKEEEV